MIIVTGAAGFIGSGLVGVLNNLGKNDIVAVDDFSSSCPEEKQLNLVGKKIIERVDLTQLMDWLEVNGDSVECVFHMGACSDTTEQDSEVFERLNLGYSKQLWEKCVKNNIPLIYASSAATYGNGEQGYEDSHDIVKDLHPLNLYGKSKNDFDFWVLQQKETPPQWAGLKFFNVYGPNEYHKGRMASVVLHSFKNIKKTGAMQLFKSHKPEYEDGGQMRDFVYVKDVIDVCIFLMENENVSGIFNVGNGKARSFLDLTKATFSALGENQNISFIDTPEDIRDKYQYYTQANMQKLRNAGYTKPFTELEDGVRDYVQNYLVTENYL